MKTDVLFEKYEETVELICSSAENVAEKELILSLPVKCLTISLVPANILNFFFEDIALFNYGMIINASLFCIAFLPLSLSIVTLINFKHKKFDFNSLINKGFKLYVLMFVALSILFGLSFIILGKVDYSVYNIIYSCFMFFIYMVHLGLDINSVKKNYRHNFRESTYQKDLDDKASNELNKLQDKIIAIMENTETINYYISYTQKKNMKNVMNFLVLLKSNGIKKGRYKTDYEMTESLYFKQQNKNKIVND